MACVDRSSGGAVTLAGESAMTEARPQYAGRLPVRMALARSVSRSTRA